MATIRIHERDAQDPVVLLLLTLMSRVQDGKLGLLTALTHAGQAESWGPLNPDNCAKVATVLRQVRDQSRSEASRMALFVWKCAEAQRQAGRYVESLALHEAVQPMFQENRRYYEFGQSVLSCVTSLATLGRWAEATATLERSWEPLEAHGSSASLEDLTCAVELLNRRDPTAIERLDAAREGYGWQLFLEDSAGVWLIVEGREPDDCGALLLPRLAGALATSPPPLVPARLRQAFDLLQCSSVLDAASEATAARIAANVPMVMRADSGVTNLFITLGQQYVQQLVGRERPQVALAVLDALQPMMARDATREQKTMYDRQRAQALRQLHRMEEALAAVNAAAGGCPKPDSGNPIHSQLLASILDIRADVLRELGRTSEADADLEQAQSCRVLASLQSPPSPGS